MKTKIFLTFILGIFLISFVSALTVSNTNFSNPDNDNYFSVNSMTLNKIVLNATATELYNVSSSGTNFTDDSDTYNATIYFIGLSTSLAVYDINTSTYVFNSSDAGQNYKATFKPLQIISLLSTLTTTCTGLTDTKLTIKIDDEVYPYVKLCYGINFKGIIPLLKFMIR